MNNFHPHQTRGLDRAAKLIAVGTGLGRFTFAAKTVPLTLRDRFWQGWVDAVQAANDAGHNVQEVFA